jgi:hypothetical protein
MSFGKTKSSGLSFQTQKYGSQGLEGNTSATTGKNSYLTPGISGQTQANYNQAGQGIQNAGAGLNRFIATANPVSLSDYTSQLYQNPYIGAAQAALTAPVQRQFNTDQYNLANQLNATNQGGGSYAALAQNLLEQNRDANLQQANYQGLQEGVNSGLQGLQLAQSQNQNSYNDLYNTLNGYNNLQNSIQQRIYTPATALLGYAGQGLQSATAGTNANLQGQQINNQNTANLFNAAQPKLSVFGTP